MHLYVGRHCDLHSETIQSYNNLQVFFLFFCCCHVPFQMTIYNKYGGISCNQKGFQKDSFLTLSQTDRLKKTYRYSNSLQATFSPSTIT